MDKQLQKLLKHHGNNFKVLPNGKKIVCTLNGHELPVQFDAVDTFIRGKKYPRLKATAEAKNELKKYEPFLVQSRNFEDKLYCALTCQLLGKSIDAIRNHMRGKKFQRAKDQYQADELELMEEPALEAKLDSISLEAAEAGPGKADAGGEAPAGNTAAGESEEADDGLWVPEEYMEMEAEAAAEAANASEDNDSEAEATAAEAAAAAAAAAKAEAAVNGTGMSSKERRQKKLKPKHKAKKARVL